MKIHAESEANDGGLEQEFREAFAFSVKGMRDAKPVDQATEQSEGRGDESAGGENDSDEKDALAHGTSVQAGGEPVQAAISIGDKFFLSTL